jgi:hypothetical protein
MPPKSRLGAPAAELLPSWMLTLSERDLSPKTLEAYGRTGTQFTKYLAHNGLPDDTAGVDALHIRAFLAAEARAPFRAGPHTFACVALPVAQVALGDMVKRGPRRGLRLRGAPGVGACARCDGVR